ncbi:MAG: hypothetical protein ABEI74_01250 [Candidatus Pacearchaeota archaeon]
MAEKLECDICGKKIKPEGLEMHKKAKHSEKTKENPSKRVNWKKIRNWTITILILGIIAFAIVNSISSVKNLPPTSPKGHIEQSPKSHVLKQPMKLTVQKHMLEHADGSGPPGIIINYNCKNYKCAENLIPKLEKFAKQYPQKVYVAPFWQMEAKIALTKSGSIKTLEKYDKKAIENFIEK